MRRPLMPIAAALALALAAPAAAQGTVKTETITPPAKAAQPNAAKSARKAGELPEILRDASALPAPVREMRERILAAARTGRLDTVAAVMRASKSMPVFSFGGNGDPAELWRSLYPDSEGVEILGILIDILEAPFVHADRGTPEEMFVWPYFYAMPLDGLTPEQLVELFQLVTGADWREMQEFGGYIFYRVGISPDGTWHFFVAGD